MEQVFTPQTIIGLIAFGGICIAYMVSLVWGYIQSAVSHQHSLFGYIFFVHVREMQRLWRSIKQRVEKWAFKKRKLPFKFSYKYLLKPLNYDSTWSKGQWRQEIVIHGKLGMTYHGLFVLGARPDGIFHYTKFYMGRWGRDWSDADMKIGLNFLDMDKEMKDIYNQIKNNGRIEVEIPKDLKEQWEAIMKNINNFEVMRAAHENKKK